MNLSAVKLRPAQQEIMSYRSGWMGVSAVPGSGKTWTLSLLAAQIVASDVLDDDQEVLVVTLVNSAVDNFYRRVSAFVEAHGLLPYMGYRVRTLHGLAHDIVRERPGLVQLDDQFTILDERESSSILRDASQIWLRTHPGELDSYLKPELEEYKRRKISHDQLPEVVRDIALSVIRTAKDLRQSPEFLRTRLDALALPLPLAQLGADIYLDYQRALDYRGAVDFDDLIRLALQALETDPGYLERLRGRWPYILEDEAQDSSRLQEEILKLLAGPRGSWVRVGDPNQAIYATFTTASPRFLIEFLARPEVERHDLPNSGRSTRSIIALANELVRWTRSDHPIPTVRDALTDQPMIQPAPPYDPQPNPPDDPTQIFLYQKRLTPQNEISVVAKSLAAWIPEHQEETVAVLVPRNTRGEELVDELEALGVPFEDGLLRASKATRVAVGIFEKLLSCLSEPGSAGKLAAAFKVWRTEGRQGDGRADTAGEACEELIRKLRRVEDFLWPGPISDWLFDLIQAGQNDEIVQLLVDFRTDMRRWHRAVQLPIDQLVLTIAQDFFTNPPDLALAHKLAVLLRQSAQANPFWRLPDLSRELSVISRHENRFVGFSEEDLGFDPERYKGKVVIATMHKAKGLEWDRVYLMSVNNYDFPSAEQGDSFIGERKFVRDFLNLQAEALGQLHSLLEPDEFEWAGEGSYSASARLDYARERLRLLYVGITRARRELVVTWNTGRNGYQTPAAALVALQNFQASVMAGTSKEEDD